MKRMVLVLTLGAWIGGLAFGQEDRGAVGLGAASVQTSRTSLLSNGLRLNLFLDISKRLSGRFYYGFEMQSDFTQLSDQNFHLSRDDVARYGLGGDQWPSLYESGYARTTYQLWEFDLSPRAFLSADFGYKVELLGFAGLNYNWQILHYTIQYIGSSTWFDPSSGQVIANPGETRSPYRTLDGNLQAVIGARLSVAYFYLDFTQYLNLSPPDLDLSRYDRSRFGAGLSLRF